MKPSEDLLFKRGLPSALHAEKAVLGALMVERNIVTMLADSLSQQDFTTERHRRIFVACVELLKSGIPVEYVSVAQVLQNKGQLESTDGLTYLVELSSGWVQGLSVDGWVQTIQDKSALRRAIFGCQAVIEEAISMAEDSPAIVERITRLTESLQSSLHVKEPLPSVMQVVEKVGISAVFGGLGASTIPSPWERLNQIIGGFERGQMVCFGARPSLGKTVALCQIARHTAGLGKTAVVFSLEMEKVSLIQRLVAAESGIALSKIRGGHMDSEERARAHTALLAITALTGLLISDVAYTIPAIRASLAKLSARSKVDVVVIDYLQLLCAPSSRRRIEEITEITRGIKLLSQQFDCTVVVASQLSRDMEKESREPRLSDLRDSGTIEQDSDIVVFPYRLPKQPEEATHVNMDFIVAKQRNGRLGRVQMVFEKPAVRFREA